MTKIAIFGVGLMGGSLALCFKGKPGIRVVGHSRNPSQVEKYVKRGVVDEATTSYEQAAADADFIFLCGPVSSLEPSLDSVLKCPLKPGCIITDVGSTKASIVSFAKKRAVPGVHFIGGHPMAGSERSGVEAASSHLYENAFYVLTPDDTASEDAYNRLVQLLQYTKAQIVRLDAELHDEIVGATSHLPHVIAVALVNQLAAYNDTNELYQVVMGGGFRDFTRIASSHPEMWRDILLNNRAVLLKLLKDWNERIAMFEELLEHEDGDGIVREFERAAAFRNQLPERRKGVLTSSYDVYVDVPDHPGIIGQIATLLGNSRINLSNIHIIESRADVPGVLRLSFRNEKEKENAISLLKSAGHHVQL